MVVAIGIEYMHTWLFKTRKQVPKVEFVQALVIFLLVAYSFVGGFIAGMMMSLLMFASVCCLDPTHTNSSTHKHNI